MSMDALLKEFVDSGKAAGVSALVYKHGGEAYFGAFGEADMESGKPFARDTIVRIYSMTKVVTTVTALACVEKGLFSIDDPVEKYIPEFAQMQKPVEDETGKLSAVPTENKITIRHLLSMTSGVRYGGIDDKYVKIIMEYTGALSVLKERRQQGENVTTMDFIRSIAACPLRFEPGTQWCYSTSIDIVGGVIEVVTGKSLYETMKELVLDPLGMNETFFSVPEDKKHRVATIYTRDEQDQMVPYDVGAFGMEGIELGGGGLFSTVDDMMRFARMLLFGGELDGVRILKPETLSEMKRPQFEPRTMPGFNWAEEVGYGYGLGVRVMLRPEESIFDECVGAFGWNGMAGTTLRISPEDGQALVFFIQNVPSNAPYFLPLVVKEARAL